MATKRKNAGKNKGKDKGLTPSALAALVRKHGMLDLYFREVHEDPEGPHAMKVRRIHANGRIEYAYSHAEGPPRNFYRACHNKRDGVIYSNGTRPPTLRVAIAKMMQYMQAYAYETQTRSDRIVVPSTDKVL